MTRWIRTLTARHPTNELEVWKTGVTQAKIKDLYEGGDSVILWRLKLVEEVLEDPRLIIKGWGRGMDDCLVYTGRPLVDYRSETITVPADPGMVFAVFLLPCGTIDHWQWRYSVPGNPDMPEEMKGKVIWPPIP
jgi:hypothetical protein